jgi:diguanylate cyclase (GGDEF)-like protein/PAS domain S-box-containing protein
MDKRIFHLSCAFVISLGCLVLLEWQFYHPLPASTDNLDIMKPTSALCFVLFGITLELMQAQFATKEPQLRNRLKQIILLCLWFVTLVGLLTLSQFLFGWDLGIDQVLIPRMDESALGNHPTRMKAITALGIVLLGIACMLLEQGTPRKHRLAQGLSSLSALVAVMSVSCHLFGDEIGLNSAVHGALMLPQSALSFMALCVGILFIQPDQGIMQTLTSPMIGSVMARRLLPWAIAFPFVMTWLILRVEQLGLYDDAFAHAFQVSIMILTFSIVIGWNARLLNRIERHRQQAEQELRKSEQRFRQVFDQAPFMVQLYAPDGSLLLANRTWQTFWHTNPDSLKHYNLRHDQQIMAMGHLPEIELAFAGTAVQLPPLFYNPTISGWAGRSRWLEVFLYPIKDEVGQVQEVVLTAQDLTDRKQAEAFLQISEERFRRALLNLPLPVMLHASNGEVLQVNHAWTEITGYAPEEMSTLTDWANLAYGNGDEKDAVKARIDRLYNLDYRIAIGEHSVRTRNGDRLWEFHSAPLGRTPDGRRLVITTVIDVTERKQTEAALRKLNDTLEQRVLARTEELAHANAQLQNELAQRQFVEDALRLSEERWQLVIEGNKEAIWDWNILTDQTMRSARWFELLGYEVNELSLSNDEWSDRIHPDDAERILLANQAYLSRQIPTYQVEYRLRCKDGSYRWFQSRAQAQWDRQGNPIRMVGSMGDISDRKQAEDLLRLQAEREQLLGAITQRVRQSLDLETVLSTTVAEVRRLLQTDRVLLYRLQPSGDGSVVTESVAPGWSSLLGQSILDRCFATQYLPHYQQGFVGAKADIYAADVDACYAELLAPFQVKATLVVPILQDGLWGLLIAHQCKTTRHWQQWEMTFLQQLAAQVGLAIHQSQLYQQTQEQAQTGQALNRVVQTIRNSLDLNTVFNTAVAEVAQLLQADRAAIAQYSTDSGAWHSVADYQLTAEAPSPIRLELLNDGTDIAARLRRSEVVRLEHTWMPSIPGQVWLDQAVVGACLLVPLHFSSTLWGCLSLVRNRLHSVWQDSEVALTRAVADHLAIAIQQSQLYQQLQSANQKLQHLALLDGLTQIPNRRCFDQYLDQEWVRMAQTQTSLALLLCDVDYFKHYNDTYGHLAGDACLVKMAQAIQRAVQCPNHLVARYGGEEFAVILPDTDNWGAIQVARSIRDAIQDLNLPHITSPTSRRVTVSLGLATAFPSSAIPVQALIDHADQALYQAKRQGRNGYCVNAVILNP